MRRGVVVALAAVLGPGLIATPARAESGTVVLTTGEVLTGDVTEVVGNDHLLIKLPNGEVRVVAWIAIGTLQIGAGGAIVIHPETAPPPPQPAPQPPPPPIVYAAPPPPPTYYAASSLPPPRPRFRPRLQLGARFGSLIPGGNLVGSSGLVGNAQVPMSDYVRPGGALEADVGLHFSPAWTFYGFWELGQLAKGARNADAADAASSNFVGVGFLANTSPRGPVGLLFDIGAGYRWVSFPVAGGPGRDWGRATFGGFEPLRLGIGLAIAVGIDAHIDVLATGSAGSFSSVSATAGSDACAATSNQCTTIPDRGTHSFGTLSVALHVDL